MKNSMITSETDFVDTEINWVLGDEEKKSSFSKYLTKAFFPALLDSVSNNNIKAALKNVILLRVSRWVPVFSGSASIMFSALEERIKGCPAREEDHRVENQNLIFYFATPQHRDQVLTFITANNSKLYPKRLEIRCLSACILF
jgi:hypothetical protein